MKSVRVGKNKGDLNVVYKSCLFKNQKRKRIYYSALVTAFIVGKFQTKNPFYRFQIRKLRWAIDQ